MDFSAPLNQTIRYLLYMLYPLTRKVLSPSVFHAQHHDTNIAFHKCYGVFLCLVFFKQVGEQALTF